MNDFAPDDDMEEVPGEDLTGYEGLELCGDLEQAASTLQQITLYALEHDDFRQEWDTSVRTAADQACAEIAGARMAGRTAGVTSSSDVIIPSPAGMAAGEAFLAFSLAVLGEVRRRLEVMMDTSPGGTG